MSTMPSPQLSTILNEHSYQGERASAGVVKQGSLYRGDSNISEDCVFKRFGILFEDGLVTRRGGENGKSSKKVWPLHAHCKLSPGVGVEERNVRVLKSSYTVVSMLYKSSKQSLVDAHSAALQFTFSVQWPSASKYLSRKTLLLGFHDRGDAEAWHAAFATVIAQLADRPDAQVDVDDKHARAEMRNRAPSEALASPLLGAHVRSASAQGAYPSGVLRAYPSNGVPPPPGHLRGAYHSNSTGHRSRPTERGTWPDSANASTRARAHHARGGSWYHVGGGSDDDESPRALSMGHDSSLSELLDNATNTCAGPCLPYQWRRYMLVNGLPIYKQGAAAADGAAGPGATASSSSSSYVDDAPALDSYMVSHRIRGSPRQVVESLAGLHSAKGSCFWAFSSITSVTELPGKDRVTVFKATMHPPGRQGWFLRPRDFFLRRLVRREEDGTYVLLFQSVDPAEHGLALTPGHVEGTIASMGFTVAPLKVQYRQPLSAPGRGGEAQSHESLVTLVLSVCLGGHLARSSWLRSTLPWWAEWEHQWVNELLQTVVALQNMVDQDCFVRGEHDIAEGFVTASTGRGASPPRRDSFATPLSSAHGNDLPAGSARSGAGAALAGDAALAATSAPAAAAPSPSAADAREPLLAPSPDADEGLPCVDTWLSRRYYSCPGTAGFKVRGHNYLRDKKKIPSDEPVFDLAGVELCKSSEVVYHVSRFLPIVRRSTAPFNFVLCFTLPFGGKVIHLVLVFEANHSLSQLAQSDAAVQEDDDDDAAPISPFELCMARFLAGRNSLRDAKVKLIPSLAKGSWVVRQAVGQTPVMLGKRLKTDYFMEDGYFEVDIDISANSTAAGVTSMVAGSIKTLVFDIGILLEAQKDDELPERLLGTARLEHLPLTAARELDTTHEITPLPRRPPGELQSSVTKASEDTTAKSSDDAVVES